MVEQKEIKNLRIIIFVIVACLVAAAVFFVNLENARAQSAEMPLMVGRLEGEGRSFKLDESEYLKITLDSSEPIKLSLESVPEMVILQLESVLDSSSATITIGGFLPSTTYHKYEDDYHNHLVFTTNEQGKYTYIQDLSKPHLVFIQPRPSTKFIKDNATGGDCYLIGNWDISTKTCTLTKNINETIQIDSNSITLDGNGYEINLNGTGFGIYLPYRTGVTIKNSIVKKSVSGIRLYYSHGNTITGNSAILNNSFGIFLLSSNNNIVTDNFVTRTYGFGMGIALRSSNNNIVKNNNSLSNSFFGAYLEESSNNIIKNNIFNSHYSAGIYLDLFSNNNTLTFNTLSNNDYGIYLYISNKNRVYNNNFINNKKRPIVYSSTGNIFNLPLPDGGNYWSDFDTPEEGCYDLNNDKICDFPYIFTGGQDNFPWTKKDGWLGPQNQLPEISNLNQFKSDAQTVISEGGITTESTVVFKATLVDPDNDQVKLQIELKEFSQAFDETNLLESDYLPSGSEAIITKDDLIDEKYKWRARAVDEKGAASGWQEFGEAGNVDFEVKLVPLYTQVRSPYPSGEKTRQWFDKSYAYATQDKPYWCGWQISGCGCAITSMVMLGRYYDIDVAIDKSDVDPGHINTWLTDSKGYAPNGNLRWNMVIDYLGFIDERTGKKMVRFDFHYKTDWNVPSNNPRIDNYVDSAKPIVAYSSRFGHYFVIDGKLGSTYTLKDPYWYNTKRLNQPKNLAEHTQGYNNHFDTANLFSYLETPRMVSSSMHLHLASPAELLVTDPLGRKLGKDPIRSIVYDEIPNSIYAPEGPIVSSDNIPDDVHESKVVYISAPADGKYNIKVIGTDTGSYTLSLLLYDENGNSKDITITGNTEINNIQEFELNYSSQTIQETNFYRLIDIDIKSGSYPNSINLKSKGVIPVAVLTNEFFDAQNVIIESIVFAEANPLRGKLEDVDNDNDLDLILHFKTQSLQLSPTDTEAVLTGQLTNGTLIKGVDSIGIVGK